MGWETGLGIALLLVGIGVYQAIGQISAGVAEFMRAYRDARENPPVDEGDLAALREQADGLHDRLDRIEERVDFNEDLLRGEAAREKISSASGRASGSSDGRAASGSEDTSEEASP